MQRRTFCSLAAVGATPSLALRCAAALADEEASGPVRIVVPHAPATSPDAVARIVAQRLTERLHQPFFVENRAGAGGSIGMAAAARMPADGRTLVVGHIGTLTINPSVYAHLQYDPARDFVPVTLAATTPLLLVTAESSPYRSVAELIAAARADRKKVTCSSAGNGTASHMAAEYFRTRAGVTITHVPFRNASEALIGVANGEVTMTFGGQTAAWPLVRGKRLRALALTSAARLPEFPDAPVVAETLEGFEILDWSGFMARAGTPAAFVAKMQQEIAAVLAEPEVVRRLRAQGLIPSPGSSADFARFIGSERGKWTQVARQVHLRLD
jgi:tripartite-type tricarboxylate transporter receptor subunit TctC